MSTVSLPESRVLAVLVTQGRPKSRPSKVETLAKSASLEVDEAKALLTALESRGLVERTKTGSWLATTQGAVRVPVAAKAPARPRASAGALDTARLLARIEQLESTLLARLGRLESALGQPPIIARGQARETPDIRASVQASVLELVKERRFGGLVPVPEVRRLAAARHGVTPSEVDSVLADLDRAFALDLKVPNDPSLASQGFEVPGRGRVYFVVPR